MSTKLSTTSEAKKPIKRRLPTNPKVTAEELTKRILFFLIENLISINKIDNQCFRSCITNNEISFIPDSETLFHLTNEIFNDFQIYFHHYFSKPETNFQICLTLHKWLPPNEINPFMFVNLHYINQGFKLCELPLGLFEFDDNNFSIFLINNEKILNRNLHFVTTNFKLSEVQKDLLNYSMNKDNNKDEIDNSIFYCLPKIILEMLGSVFIELHHGLKLDHMLEISNCLDYNNYCSNDGLSHLVQMFLGNIYIKLIKLDFESFVPSPEDKNNIYFDILNKNWLKSKKSFTLTYLSAILFYRNSINSSTLTEQDWELITFIYDLTIRFQEIICCCNANENPNVHMLSKWLKIAIIHVSTFLKCHPSICNIKIDSVLISLLDNLKQIHNNIQDNFNMIISSYLHPSTKRYLNDQQVGKINNYVGKLTSPNVKGGQDKDNNISLSIDNIDDMIMQLFDCSGKATKECYNYETSSTSEIKYSKNSSYIAKENGPFLLQFWEKNQYKYNNLSKLASKSLSIQLSTNLESIESFKKSFANLQTYDHNYSIQFLQQYYVLHGLSMNYDLQSFDVKNFDSDIDNFRLDRSEYVDMDIDSSFEIDINDYQGKRFKK
ncbi:hypothetical protein DFJ63DRAFT_193998 [Scheffersomyces coipomensis]|uniref:uncharacterized protein n=1 Tax=Scheffersomyces coipomensis TaxID=1788519 RepID=UPI00315DADCC